tara:strand:+ start:751 stop:927 length:177 start_codon:yes stop_codon:yes gene_type:complete
MNESEKTLRYNTYINSFSNITWGNFKAAWSVYKADTEKIMDHFSKIINQQGVKIDDGK